MSEGGAKVEQTLACLATVFYAGQSAGGLMKMAESGETAVDTESQSCYSTVTSPAGEVAV